MSRSSSPRGVVVAMAAILVAAAILLLVLRASMPLGTARSATEHFANSLASRDVAAIEAASTPAFFQRLLESLSRHHYERARYIYQEVMPELAGPQWHRYRQKAGLLAAQEYERLRQRVHELGTSRFAQLSVDERMRLIDSNAYDRYVTSAGLQALPEPDRKAVGDLAAFGTREGRSTFVERQSWDLLPAADRAVLGSAEALSSEDTAAKLAFFDKVGLPLLPEEDRRMVSRFPRPTVADLTTFARAHGAQLAKELLAAVTTQPPSRADCRYAQTDAGSILWPSVASCDIAMVINSGVVRFRLDPVKWAGHWQIQSTSDELTAALAP